MTPLAKQIYNTFLKVSRSQQGKFYKFRKDFEDFEKNPNFAAVSKLENFFRRFPHINIEEFLKAPYEVYPEDAYYNLDFYLSPRAIKVYNIFNQRRCNAKPDSQIQLDFVTESLRFIGKFCKERNLQIEQYIEQKEGYYPTFVLHLKEHKISIYVLFGWDRFDEIISAVPKEDLDLAIGHLYKDLANYRREYVMSTSCKNYVKSAIRILGKYLATGDKSNK